MFMRMSFCIAFLLALSSGQLYCPSFAQQSSEEESLQEKFNKAQKQWATAQKEYKKKYPAAEQDVFDQKTAEGKKVHEAQGKFYLISNQLRDANYSNRMRESLEAQELCELRQNKEQQEKEKKKAEAEKLAQAAAANTNAIVTAWHSKISQAHSTYDQQQKLQAARARPLLNRRFARGRVLSTLPSAEQAQQPQAPPLTPPADYGMGREEETE
jgi:hypothetical protein